LISTARDVESGISGIWAGSGRQRYLPIAEKSKRPEEKQFIGKKSTYQS